MKLTKSYWYKIINQFIHVCHMILKTTSWDSYQLIVLFRDKSCWAHESQSSNRNLVRQPAVLTLFAQSPDRLVVIVTGVCGRAGGGAGMTVAHPLLRLKLYSVYSALCVS